MLAPWNTLGPGRLNHQKISDPGFGTKTSQLPQDIAGMKMTAIQPGSFFLSASLNANFPFLNWNYAITKGYQNNHWWRWRFWNQTAEWVFCSLLFVIWPWINTPPVFKQQKDEQFHVFPSRAELLSVCSGGFVCKSLPTIRWWTSKRKFRKENG